MGLYFHFISFHLFSFLVSRMSQHSPCHTIYYVGKFIKKKACGKTLAKLCCWYPQEREKPIFRDFFVALSQSFSKTFSEFCIYITKRKSEKSQWWELWVCHKVCVRWRLCQKVWVCRKFGTKKEFFPSTPSQSLLYFSFTLLLHMWAW